MQRHDNLYTLGRHWYIDLATKTSPDTAFLGTVACLSNDQYLQAWIDRGFTSLASGGFSSTPSEDFDEGFRATFTLFWLFIGHLFGSCFTRHFIGNYAFLWSVIRCLHRQLISPIRYNYPQEQNRPSAEFFFTSFTGTKKGLPTFSSSAVCESFHGISNR